MNISYKEMERARKFANSLLSEFEVPQPLAVPHLGIHMVLGSYSKSERKKYQCITKCFFNKTNGKMFARPTYECSHTHPDDFR